MIKKLVYMGNMNDLNARHKKAMAHMNLMNLYQENFRDVQDFRDQYVAMKKVCEELGLLCLRCEDDAMAILTEKSVTNPMDDVKKKHHAFVFYIQGWTLKYGKLVELMDNDMLQKRKAPFPKTIADTCRVLAGWKNWYGGKDNVQKNQKVRWQFSEDWLYSTQKGRWYELRIYKKR